MTFVPDEQLDLLMERLHELDETKPMLGLRAFAWNVEKSI